MLIDTFLCNNAIKSHMFFKILNILDYKGLE